MTLKEFMEKQNLTLTKLGELTNIHITRLSRIVNGKEEPTKKQVELFEKLFSEHGETFEYVTEVTLLKEVLSIKNEMILTILNENKSLKEQLKAYKIIENAVVRKLKRNAKR